MAAVDGVPQRDHVRSHGECWPQVQGPVCADVPREQSLEPRCLRVASTARTIMGTVSAALPASQRRPPRPRARTATRPAADPCRYQRRRWSGLLFIHSASESPCLSDT